MDEAKSHFLKQAELNCVDMPLLGHDTARPQSRLELDSHGKKERKKERHSHINNFLFDLSLELFSQLGVFVLDS